MAQLKAPARCRSTTIGDLHLDVGDDGIVNVPDGVDFRPLLDHGFALVRLADVKPMQKADAESKMEVLRAKEQMAEAEKKAGDAFLGKSEPVKKAKK